MFGRPPFPTGPRAFLSYWHVSPGDAPLSGYSIGGVQKDVRSETVGSRTTDLSLKFCLFFRKPKYIPKVLSARKWYKRKNGLNSAGCRRRTTISANSSNLDIKMMGAMDPTGNQLWNLMHSKSMTIVTIPFEHNLVTFFSCKMVYTTWKPEETTPVLVAKETKYCEGHFFERGDYATWKQLLKVTRSLESLCWSQKIQWSRNCWGIEDFEGEWNETSKHFSSSTTDML